MNKVIEIDGYAIIIDGITQHNPNPIIDDSLNVSKEVIKWTTDQVNAAMKPAVSIMNSLRETAAKMAPDEMELAMQFGIELNGETPVFKVLSADATAQISVKFVWKNDNQKEKAT